MSRLIKVERELPSVCVYVAVRVLKRAGRDLCGR